MEGMAAADTAQRQPTALERTEAGYCLHRVFGTGGKETAARAQHGTDEAFVNPQQGYEETADHRLMICDLADFVVAAPVRVGYKDAPFPGPGS